MDNLASRLDLLIFRDCPLARRNFPRASGCRSKLITVDRHPIRQWRDRQAICLCLPTEYVEMTITTQPQIAVADARQSSADYRRSRKSSGISLDVKIIVLGLDQRRG